MNIQLKPQMITEEIFLKLENLNIVSRLMPGKHTLDVKTNSSRHETIYATEDHYGPHKLICVTINEEHFNHLTYHSAAEEFILLDRLKSTPLMLVVALIDHETLRKKIKDKTFSSEDLLVLIMKPNDPYLSFFTMQPGYAHVEICMKTSETPPSFYVTESRDIDENKVVFDGYHFTIERT